MRGYHVQAWLTCCWNRQQSSQATQFKVDGSWLAVEFIYIYINSFVWETAGNSGLNADWSWQFWHVVAGMRPLQRRRDYFGKARFSSCWLRHQFLGVFATKHTRHAGLWSKSTKILCDGGGACQQWKSAALQQESKWEGEYPTDSYKSYSIWVLFHLFDPIWSIGSMRRKTQRPMCPGLRRKGGVANSAPKAGRMTCARCSWWVPPPKMCALNPKKVGTRQPFFRADLLI